MKNWFNTVCAAMLVALTTLSASSVKGAATPNITAVPKSLNMGSTNALITQAWATATGYGVDLWAPTVFGTTNRISTGRAVGHFASVTAMNNWFTNAVKGAAAQLLITTNLNMSGVFQLNVSVMTLSTNGYTWESMWGTTYFQMIHTSSNTWLIPATMTNFMFIPTPLITYPYPSVNWALMEIWDMHGNPVTRLDSRIQGSATNVADSTQGALFLPTPYNVGGYKVKLTTVTTDNVFAVYNETGTMVAETLPSLSVVRTNSTVRVHVSVGQPGRTYFLQASTSPSGGAWTNVTSGHVAGYTGLDPGFDYTEPASAFGRHYFRVMGQ